MIKFDLGDGYKFIVQKSERRDYCTFDFTILKRYKQGLWECSGRISPKMISGVKWSTLCSYFKMVTDRNYKNKIK